MTDIEKDVAMIRGDRKWTSANLCLKKLTQPGEETEFGDYSRFGIIARPVRQGPVVVYLRSLHDDLTQTAEYATVEELLAAGWRVD